MNRFDASGQEISRELGLVTITDLAVLAQLASLGAFPDKAVEIVCDDQLELALASLARRGFIKLASRSAVSQRVRAELTRSGMDELRRSVVSRSSP